MDNLVKELIGRENEKQHRLMETRNIVQDQFQDLFKLIGMEADYLNNLSNFSKIGENAKIFLKIPKSLDTEGRIDYLMNNIEENIRNEYKDKKQLKYYEIGKTFVEYFNKRKGNEIVNNNGKLDQEQDENNNFKKLFQLRGLIENTFHSNTRKKIIESAKYLLFCKIKFRYHFNFQQILSHESSISTFDAWCAKYSIVERFNNEIRNIYYKQQLFSNRCFDLNSRISSNVSISDNAAFNLSRKISSIMNRSMKTILGLYLVSLIISDPNIQHEETVENLRILFTELVNRTKFKYFSRLSSDMKFSIITNLVTLKCKRRSYSRFLINKYQISQKEEKLIRLMFLLNNSGVNKLLKTKKRELEKQLLTVIFPKASHYISLNDFMFMSNLYNIENIISPLLLVNKLEFLSTLSNQNHAEELYQLWEIFDELFNDFKLNRIDIVQSVRMEIGETVKYICQKLTSLVISAPEGTVLFVEEILSLLETSYHSLKPFPDLQNMIEHTLQYIIKL